MGVPNPVLLTQEKADALETQLEKRHKRFPTQVEVGHMTVNQKIWVHLGGNTSHSLVIWDPETKDVRPPTDENEAVAVRVIKA